MGYRKKAILITDDEYARAEHQIYNDLPFALDEIAPVKIKTLDEEFVKEVVIEGEKWISIEDRPHMILTSYSRLINTDTKRIIKPAISNLTIYWTVNEISVRSSKEFPKYGWKYNHKENVKRYLDLNWPIQRNGHKYLKGELSYLFEQRTI